MVAHLAQTAGDENMSRRAYIAAISRWMWGGRPEARVFADHMPVAIWCWTPEGALVYKEAGYVDSWDNACPVIDIHLGLHARHYVLLRAASSKTQYFMQGLQLIVELEVRDQEPE